MSKLAKKPIAIPGGVTVEVKDSTLVFSGKEGTVALPILPDVMTAVNDKEISITLRSRHKQALANWGTMASLVENAVQGVSKGFTKTLEIEGIGFKASMDGTVLVLNVGYTHPVRFVPPDGVKITVNKALITVSGLNKQTVGQAAAEIRKIKKPEPYKGKGIHYLGEIIRRKAGKKVAGVGVEKK